MIGGGWLNVEPGEVTDDTQMTLAVAEGIVSQGDSVIAPLLMVGCNFLWWYRTAPKDIGNACRAAIGEMDGKENVFLV
jgi:ADP-ribosyl-[dinitrogen reductase] hydrolase